MINKNKISNLKKDRRSFLKLTTSSMAAIGSAFAIWPFIDSMNPSADVLALGSKEFDISNIEEGSSKTVKWRGKPVFIKHRTKKEINEAREVNLIELRDPQKDENRVLKPEWLIVVGVCSHLGCIPLGQKKSDTKEVEVETDQGKGPALRVAVMGFCWGGGLAVRAAQELDVAGAVVFYGTRLPAYFGTPVRAPVTSD